LDWRRRKRRRKRRRRRDMIQALKYIIGKEAAYTVYTMGEVL